MTKQLIQSAIDPLGERLANLLRFRRLSIDTYPVRVVVTGIEHSGTTLLSTLLQQDRSLNCGFECGFLLADSPRAFKHVHPWYEWMQEPISAKMWGLSAGQLERICGSKTWQEAYRKLIKFSPVFDKKHFQQVCDKTPRYLCCLDTVLDKLPDFIPCLVIEKNVESLWRSHRRRNINLEEFSEVYLKYNNGLRRALQRHGSRIHQISYEALCNNLYEQLSYIFSIVDLPFRPEYASKKTNRIQGYYKRMKRELKPLTGKEEDCLNILREETSDLQIFGKKSSKKNI